MESNRPFLYLEGWVTGGPDSGLGIKNVSDFLGLGLNIIFGTAVAISMIALIVSGIKFITCDVKDPRAKQTAKTGITYSVVAFILTIAAYTIKTIIFNVVGGDYGSLTNATPNF